MADTQNLLVVDWDYFFPELTQDPEQWWLYDWGHQESSLFLGPLWTIRASDFDRAGVPRPRMNDEWIGFWDRFDIDDDATLYYSESNSAAYHPEVQHSAANRTAEVWLYDAHHDCGYHKTVQDILKEQRVTCEDWMVAYRLQHRSQLHVRYPTWKTWAIDKEPQPIVPVDRGFDNGLPNDVHFDTVFVCRSGAWTPPWCDRDFTDFITDAPVNELYGLDDGGTEPREWDEDEVKRLRQAEDSFHAQREAPQSPQEPS